MKKRTALVSMPFKNFAELEHVIEGIIDNKEKGDAMELFAFFYLKQHSDIFDIKEIYLEDEIPQEIRIKLRLERKDNGVDGVIERNDGNYVAYQVKFRSNRSIPTAQDLSTFWAESEYADYRLIIANCPILPKVSDKKKNQLSLLVDSFLDLDEDFFINFKNSIIEKPLIKKEKYLPLPYQRKILDDIKSGFKNHDRGKLIAACGIGKTLTAMWLQEEMKSSTVLYIVPSLALIKQTLESWMEQHIEPFDFLCVCSDKTVIGDFEEDEIDYSASDMAFPVTTNPVKIDSFLTKENDKKIIFATYNSLDAVANALNGLPDFNFDLAIFDESHRTAGTKDSLMFIYGMSDEYIKISKRLFMTATERLVSPRIKSALSSTDNVVFSMDDIQKYGPTFSSLNFGDAISENIICDYRIVVATITEKDIYDLFKSNNIVSSEIGEEVSTTDLNTILKQVLTGKVMKDLDVKKMITYHSYVKNARTFVKGSSTILPIENIIDNILNASSNESVYTDHINGSMSAGIRKEILSKFETSSRGLISNAKCLTEGVDVPAIEAVYFVDPKSSMIDIVQAVGRALRKSPTKQNDFSYIIIPVIIPEEASIFGHIETSSFDTLHNVVQAMRSQDESLADIIDEINFSAATGTLGNKSNKLSSKILFMPYSKLNIQDFEHSLQLRIAEINKNPSDTDKPSVWVENTLKARKSNFKRVFVSIGDYTLDAYKDSLIMPTLSKFDDIESNLSGSELKINHNNVSHSVRMGVIKKAGNNYSLTPIGKTLIQNDTVYPSIVKEQILKYHCYNKEDNEILFPYRALMKIFLELDHITRFEFLYCIYSLRSTSDHAITNAISRINYLRDTYPNINILSNSNKEKVLTLLNTKYEVEFGFKDIWTSRTTTYNQFNYFKKHLWAFDKVFIVDDSTKDDREKIRINTGTRSAIQEMLKLTEAIEKPVAENDLTTLESLYQNRISSQII